jgi:hypothetical protein
MSRRFTLEDLQRKGFQVEGAKASKSVNENKIRNAQKNEIDGVKFASKLELFLYNLLKVTKIRFEFQVEYELQPGFRFHGSKIQPIKIIPDFYLPDHDMIIDTKGFQLADNKIKFKMLKNKLVSDGKNTTIELPRTKEECEALVNKLLSHKKTRQ